MGKKQKKRKYVKYDEYYSNGKFELGRIGNLVSMRSFLSSEDSKERNRIIATEYETAKKDIDSLVEKIICSLMKCDPLMTLIAATDLSMSQLLIFPESQLNVAQENNLRLIEYIQTIYVSKKPTEPVELSNEEQTSIMFEVFAQIEELYNRIQRFYVYWAAKKQEEGSCNEDEIEYIVESQLMSNVRGNRYQFLQIRDLEKLLLPHTPKMMGVYGMTAEKIIQGLKKLEYSLSSEKLDSFKKIAGFFEEFKEAVSGKTEEEVVEEMRKRQDDNLRSLFANCFEAKLYDVKNVTGWTDSFIDGLTLELGEADVFLKQEEYAGWPIQDLPVQKKPFIRLNNVSYCFDYYNLFDNIYRIIQKNIKEHDEEYVNEWSRLQQEASECLVAEKFKKILPTAEVYVGNYYPKTTSLKQMDENDILIICDNQLIIVEVKAGSFTYTPAILDYEAHQKSFATLIEKADYQCLRTLDYIKRNNEAVFYDKSKNKKFIVKEKQIQAYFTLCVTVDNFNVFEAKIEKNKFFDMNSGTIAICLDDLDVYEEYFDSELCFLHFLKHRKASTRVQHLMLNDELEHLGMYISQNAYEEYAKEFEGYNSFVADGFREELDAYFAGLYNPVLKVDKPTQWIPEYIEKIIHYLEKNRIPGRVDFSNFLLDMDYDARKQFDEEIRKKIQREKELGYVSPFWVEGDFAYCCFVMVPGVDGFDYKTRRKYVYANMLDRKRIYCWEINIDVDSNSCISDLRFQKCFYDGHNADGINEEEIRSYIEFIKRHRKLQGVSVPPVQKKRIYPNELCPCGSGKKYKKCCGKK